MILNQYYLGCLSQASYLIGDTKTKTAVIVDPRRDIESYLDEAKALGLTIRHVFLTHFHADYVSGHIGLRDETGATIHMGARANPDFAFAAMQDGDSLTLGNVRFTVWETPGHTPESICILVFDLEKDPEHPESVLTGDTLFIGDVGRPDLMASQGVTAESLASDLYDSINHKLLKLPDDTKVFPAHGAGSMCGKNLSSETVSTIGLQRRLNYALQKMERDEFVRLVTADQPPAPAYFAYDADLNRREHITLEENLKQVLVPLSAQRTLELQAGGAQVLDVRGPAAYCSRYLRGSLNVGLDGTYAMWAGTVLDRERPVIVLADPGGEGEAVMRLGRIGFDRVAGFVEGGIGAFDAYPHVLASADRVNAEQLSASMKSASPPLVLDVRNPGERDTKRIEDTDHIPLGELPRRVREVPRDRDVVVYCAGGYRSSIAASLLRAAGDGRVLDLEGGIDAWERAVLGAEGGT